jgi:hypothetical protein
MPRQTKNSRSRLEVSSQATPSLLRHREVAISPIRMAENNEFDDDINGGEDNVNGEDGEDAENAAAADVQQFPPMMIPEGIDPAVAELLKMQHQNQSMMMQAIMNNQMAQMEKQLDCETRERQILARELAKRDSGIPKIVGKAPKFDMEKDRDNFKTWKLKWADFLISSNINSIGVTGAQDEQKKAAHMAALSDDTLKWINGQGFDHADLMKAEFIIQKIDEHIQGTTNPYVQVVDLIRRKKSANESFDHFVTHVCERVKRCALNKVTNITDWFTTMIIMANHNNTDVRKKLLLHQDLKLDKAKAICKEEEKAAKTSPCLGHHERLRVTTTGRHKSSRQNLQQVSRPTSTIGEEATNIVEAVEDNVEAAEVSSTKIEEDPNPENVPTVEIVQKAETDQHQGTETQVPVTGAADRTKARVGRLTKSVTIA